MARELVPGVLSDLMAKLAVEVARNSREVLEPVALVIERQAKINASSGQHAPRTKTPASPGSGPARISGSLVNSITHSEAMPSALGGWEMKVGVVGGLYPYYNKRTSAGQYAYYLEVTGAGKSRVKYPFLEPAAKFAKSIALFSVLAGGLNISALM
jgi:hypothetical protein